MPWLLLKRKRDPGYYDRWLVIDHAVEREHAERAEQEYAKRFPKVNTCIIETVGAPYSTVPGNGAEPAMVMRIVTVPDNEQRDTA